MSWTTSPGSSRGSAKTMNDAIRNDGIATRSRCRTYPDTSAVEPRGHEAPPVVVADVRREVPHRGVPGDDDAERRPVEVVRLLGEIALDVVEDLPPPARVERPALEPDHLGELRVVDPPRVARLAWDVEPVEVAVGLRPVAEHTDGELLELPYNGGGLEGPVLLQLELALDPRRLPVLELRLHPVHVVGPV